MKEDLSRAGIPRAGDHKNKSGVATIILRSLMPLALLVVIAVSQLLLFRYIQFLLGPTSFFPLEQFLYGGVMIAGLSLALITSLLSVKRTLRQVEMWQQRHQTTRALAGLTGLMLLALLIISPVILALFLSAAQ
ncbi:MAG TPA: hypothetical protein VFQ30_02445 [Ktedonobacteraceae bacterium]|nr:hypothetical protein [Ktedonobacteraceae bacterium]